MGRWKFGSLQKSVKAFQADQAGSRRICRASYPGEDRSTLKAPTTDYKKLYEDTKKQLDAANKKLADIKKIVG